MAKKSAAPAALSAAETDGPLEVVEAASDVAAEAQDAPVAEKPSKKPKDPSKGPEGEPLVKVTKDGEEIYVNPTCVKSHKDAGWKIAEA